jgi:hypothetical protein
VKLKDSLMSAISFSHARDADLAWVEGQIHFVNPASTPTVPTAGLESNANVEKNNKDNLVPTLDTVPSVEVGWGRMGLNITLV